MNPFVFVSTATVNMGAPQYIRLCQEHFAELQFSIIVVVKGGQAFRFLASAVAWRRYFYIRTGPGTKSSWHGDRGGKLL